MRNVKVEGDESENSLFFLLDGRSDNRAVSVRDAESFFSDSYQSSFDHHRTKLFCSLYT